MIVEMHWPIKWCQLLLDIDSNFIKLHVDRMDYFTKITNILDMTSYQSQ